MLLSVDCVIGRPPGPSHGAQSLLSHGLLQRSAEPDYRCCLSLLPLFAPTSSFARRPRRMTDRVIVRDACAQPLSGCSTECVSVTVRGRSSFLPPAQEMGARCYIYSGESKACKERTRHKRLTAVR